MRAVATALVALLAAAGSGGADPLPQEAPLPPPRPEEPPVPPARPTPSPEPERPTPGPAACLGRLEAAGHRAEAAQPPPQPLSACVIEEPVRLVRVAAGPERSVALPEQPIIACALAEQLAGWIGRSAAPILEARMGSPLAAIRTGPGQECRTRNRQPGEKLSAHGLGLALDLAAFDFADKRVLAVAAMPKLGVAPDASGEPGATLQALRLSACGWFTTVLGPGSDAYHGDHLHLDVEPHGTGGNYRICQ